MREHCHIQNRRRSVIGWHQALAQCQGFTPVEARRRATLQVDLDEAFTNRQLTITDGLVASGWGDSDWDRICDGVMPTHELATLVGYAQRLPRPGQPPRDMDGYMRDDFGPGPHGLFP